MAKTPIDWPLVPGSLKNCSLHLKRFEQHVQNVYPAKTVDTGSGFNNLLYAVPGIAPTRQQALSTHVKWTRSA